MSIGMIFMALGPSRGGGKKAKGKGWLAKRKAKAASQTDGVAGETPAQSLKQVEQGTTRLSRQERRALERKEAKQRAKQAKPLPEEAQVQRAIDVTKRRLQKTAIAHVPKTILMIFPDNLNVEVRRLNDPDEGVWAHHRSNDKEQAYESLAAMQLHAREGLEALGREAYVVALKHYQNVMDEARQFGEQTDFLRFLNLQIMGDIHRTIASISRLESEKITHLAHAHSLIVESHVRGLAHLVELAFDRPDHEEDLVTAIRAHTTWAREIREALLDQLYQIVGKDDEQRRSHAADITSVLRSTNETLDGMGRHERAIARWARTLAMADLAMFLVQDTVAFLKARALGIDALADLGRRTAVRMVQPYIDDVDAFMEKYPDDVARLRRIKGLLTRMHSAYIADAMMQRLNWIFQEAAEMIEHDAHLATKMNHGDSRAAVRKKEAFLLASAVLGVEPSNAFALDMRERLSVELGVADVEGKADAGVDHDPPPLMLSSLSPHIQEHEVIRDLALTSGANSDVRCYMTMARKSLTTALRSGDPRQRDTALAQAREELAHATHHARRIRDASSRKPIVETLRRARALVATLESDYAQIPTDRVLIDRIARGVSFFMPSLSAALLDFTQITAATVNSLFSRDGVPAEFTDSLLPENSDIASRAEVVSLVRRHGLEDRPERFMVWNYWLAKAVDNTDWMQGLDLPTEIALSPGLTSFAMMRRAVGFVSGHHQEDLLPGQLTMDALFNTAEAGIAMGLDPIEVLELSYAHVVPHLADDDPAALRTFDARVDLLRRDFGYSAYGQLVLDASMRGDRLQKAIYCGRWGAAYEHEMFRVMATMGKDVTMEMIGGLSSTAREAYTLARDTIGELRGRGSGISPTIVNPFIQRMDESIIKLDALGHRLGIDFEAFRRQERRAVLGMMNTSANAVHQLIGKPTGIPGK